MKNCAHNNGFISVYAGNKLVESKCVSCGVEAFTSTSLEPYLPIDSPQHSFDRLNAGIELHKERCARIKIERELASLKETHKQEILILEDRLDAAKRNWWRKFRLPKIVWRDEYDD